jgi:starch synthase
MRILHVAAEMAPFAKAGGLADVAGGLSSEQAAAGHDVRVVMPDYREVRPPHLALQSTGQPHHTTVGGGEVYFVFQHLPDFSGYASTYFVTCREFFGSGGIYGSGEREAQRFLLLTRAAIQLCRDLQWSPDIVHCHDWHTAMVPLLLAEDRHTGQLFRDSRTVLTIHNIGYQGVFPTRVLDEAGLGRIHQSLEAVIEDEINFLRAGIGASDALTTVSPTHADEVRTPAYGMGLDKVLSDKGDRFVGILNGADYRHWNPATDGELAKNYSMAELDGKTVCKEELLSELSLDMDLQAPLLGLVSRLVEQKGIDLVVAALPGLLVDRGIGLAVLGDGEAVYANALRELAERFPDRVAFVQGYDEGLSHRIVAASDMFLVPSRYEPCGLTQMYAMRYGSVPIVRMTGGLADTVSHFDPNTGEGTGSVFRDADANGLRWAVDSALTWYREADDWARVQANGMRCDFSWREQAPQYEALYRRTLAQH